MERKLRLGATVKIALLPYLEVHKVSDVLNRGGGVYSYRIEPDGRWWARGDLKLVRPRKRRRKGRGK